MQKELESLIGEKLDLFINYVQVSIFFVKFHATMVKEEVNSSLMNELELSSIGLEF